MTKGMFMIFKIFRKLKFYLDKAAYMQGVPQFGGPSILIKYKFNFIKINLSLKSEHLSFQYYSIFKTNSRI